MKYQIHAMVEGKMKKEKIRVCFTETTVTSRAETARRPDASPFDFVIENKVILLFIT
jgi:hypothetical protein